MIGLMNKLKERKENNKSIKIALAGAGLMGKGLVSQLTRVEGMEPALVIDRNIEKTIESYKLAGIDELDIVEVENLEELDENLKKGKYIVCRDIDLLSLSDQIDIVIDATGNPETGAKIALDSINNGKDIIMLNVETDMVVGPILNKKAKEKGVVYTGTAGDEPGSVKELYDFAKLSGFEVIGIGKGKNNPIDYEATAKILESEAKKSGVNPRMLTGFVDGTNTMIELTVMANATGFIPDIRGARGLTATVDELADMFRLKEDGGMMNKSGVVDYVHGIAPGVFAIVTSELPQIHRQMKFLKMGDGPYYILYRPFHLTSLETPISVARAVIDRQATIAPIDGPVCDTITVAKKDMKAGESFDFIGGDTVYGSIDTYEIARKENLLPIGLINTNTKAKVDIKKGEYITYDMVELDKDTLLYKLREEQDQFFK